MADVTNINGVNMIALAYHAKYDNGKKVKTNKDNFLSFFWQHTVSPHYQVSQQIRNDIIQIGQYLYQSL